MRERRCKTRGNFDFVVVRPCNQHQGSRHLGSEASCKPFIRSRGLQCNVEVGIAGSSKRSRNIDSNAYPVGATMLLLARGLDN